LFLFHGNASKCIEHVVNVTLLFLMILFFYSAASAMAWIKHYVPDADVPLKDQATSKAVAEALKDGIVLCQLANALECVNPPIKFNQSKMAFKQMENIGKYLEATYEYGVSKNDSFQTVDLYEVQNMAAVINGIHALGRKAGTKGKLGIGPKESQQNKREFTEEQLRAGDGVIGLQMGSNKGASQAGQNFGKTRSIID